MTRKHFIAMAATIKHRFDWADNEEQRNGIKDVTMALCEDFAAANPNFDRAKFLRACGF